MKIYIYFLSMPLISTSPKAIQKIEFCPKHISEAEKM